MSDVVTPCMVGVRWADAIEELSPNAWKIVAIEEIVCGIREWTWTVDKKLLTASGAITAHRRAEDGAWTIVARLPKARGRLAA